MISRDGKLYKAYAYVIDGEVVWTHNIDHEIESLNAIFQSNPTIVEVPESIENEISPNSGWTYDGTNFIPPQ